MATARKFDFTNSFDVSERGMIAARDYTLADLDQARREGFEEGKAAGAEEARGSIERQIGDALARIGETLAVLRTEADAIRDRAEADALETVLAIARKVVPHYAWEHTMTEIEGLVHDCLASVYDEPRVVVRVHDSLLDDLKLRIDDIAASSGFGGKVVLFADGNLAPTDCRVEWADGGTERNVSRLWEEVDRMITRFLEASGRPASRADAAPDAAQPPTPEAEDDPEPAASPGQPETDGQS